MFHASFVRRRPQIDFNNRRRVISQAYSRSCGRLGRDREHRFRRAAIVQTKADRRSAFASVESVGVHLAHLLMRRSRPFRSLLVDRTRVGSGLAGNGCGHLEPPVNMCKRPW